MNLTGLLPTLLRDPGASAAVEHVRARGFADVVGPAGVRPPLLAAAAGQRPLVVVAATGREADDLAASLRGYLPEDHADDVAVLPAWETLPHERLSPRADTVAKRLAVFRRLAHPAEGHGQAGAIRILVLPVRALLQPVVDGLGELEPVQLDIGATADLTDVAERLTAAAYTRVDMVERRGEFAVRGGILDVFPPTEDHPLRCEFWGDEITEIRWFAVADQRSLEIAERGVWAPPCREILLDDAVRTRAAELVESLPGAVEMLDKLAAGVAVEGMESLAPVLVDRMVPVLELVPDDALLVVNEPERVRRRAHDLVATTEEFLAAAWTGAVAGGAAPIDLSAASFETFAEVREIAARRGLGWWTLSSFTQDTELTDVSDTQVTGVTSASDTSGENVFTISARDVESYRGDLARALDDVHGLQVASWRLVLTTEGHGPAKRMTEQLSAAGTAARLAVSLEVEPEPGVVHVVAGGAGKGFVAPDLKLAVFSEQDLTGRTGSGTRDMRKMPSRRRNVVDPLQLKAGDFVVHEQHGVGRFVEMAQRTMGTGGNRATREYLVIEYASSKRGQPGDRLFVPTDQLDQVTKYTGGESPSLSKMGGADWKNTKAKARKHVKEIAGELIRLYSARMATQGHAYGPDTPWQRELEDAFPHTETPDQATTIDEVKRDMESDRPMDRLVCGDVGYGKTEIAVRSAFKAVMDGKQVAVLVPTTLLAEQHFQTFSERYAPFPVKVAMLSRFLSAAEQKRVLADLAAGKVDVIIGTHRLLSQDAKFKDLGLLVVDEEQRFGVAHKERLKKIRASVDVLTMTATPIPRTLEMALTGVREISVVDTPPEDRQPILTYVGAYDEGQAVAAVRRELLRDGQVFWVHNQIRTIDGVARTIQEKVPDARVVVAHGQMDEALLEKQMIRFWDREADVLVCTTIIESGLDVPTANTLVVDRADKLGLAQLYQLRGRVGRSSERAFSYFFFPRQRALTEEAHARLATISEHTALGSGFRIALRDLEIRGAGNLLGAEQHGHIAAVGFDTYVRLLQEAVAEMQGEPLPERKEIRVDLPVKAFLPVDYVGSEPLRLELYRRISDPTNHEELAEIRAELEDRFGDVPEEVESLLELVGLRLTAERVGVEEIATLRGQVRVKPVRFRAEEGGADAAARVAGATYRPATATLNLIAALRGPELIRYVRRTLEALEPALEPPIDTPDG